MNSIRRKDRRYWVLSGIALGSFLLLWGGNKLLGLAWRNRPALILCLTAIVSFLACIWYVAVRGWKKRVPQAVLVLCAMVVSVFFVIVVLRFTKVVKTGWNPTIPPGGFHRVSSTVCKGRKMSAEWNKLVRFFIRASSLL